MPQKLEIKNDKKYSTEAQVITLETLQPAALFKMHNWINKMQMERETD